MTAFFLSAIAYLFWISLRRTVDQQKFAVQRIRARHECLAERRDRRFDFRE